ncbi:hypothetical protein SAMN05660236_2154 [Ohtaekwangia koreensis]|uniref:Uncharacterized protein n=2 Tax=Ohtaekwangia koreensis TaxID=688867 RepID=A0A1T5KG52_9BACT|nr:hypothetical protein SAMN05660236_2154 [Ohtaekwangia koreensis]
MNRFGEYHSLKTKNVIFGHCMKRIFLFLVLTALLLPACSKKSGSNISVVKPKYHHRWYDRKKDRRTKRTKSIRVRN